ncbi:MAG: HIT family protein [Anaerolineae bacterium]
MSDRASDCVFCKIVQGQLPAVLVYEDAHTLAFLDHRPASLGHTLVIPRRHAETLLELDAEEVAQLFRAVLVVADAVRAELQPDGFNVWQSNGAAAGQVVHHVHVHVLPRHTGDGLVHLYRPQTPPTRETLEALGARLSGRIDAPARG